MKLLGGDGMERLLLLTALINFGSALISLIKLWIDRRKK